MLEIREERSSGIYILTLTGEWDLYERERVEAQLRQSLQSQPKGLIINLAGITLLDSSAVEVLIWRHIESKQTGIPVAFVIGNNNYIIRKFRNLGIFDQTGLRFFDTVEDAKRSLSDKP